MIDHQCLAFGLVLTLGAGVVTGFLGYYVYCWMVGLSYRFQGLQGAGIPQRSPSDLKAEGPTTNQD